MKLKRLVASVLALLLVVSLLPMTALAEEEHLKVGEGTGEDNSHYESNTKDNVTVDSGVTVGTNTGDNVTNEGTITSNEGTITTNGVEPAEGQKADLNSGIVENNSGTVENNYGLVGETNQYGQPIIDGSSGNSGTIVNNSGIVCNTKTGTVEVNDVGGSVYVPLTPEEDAENPQVKTNYGTVLYRRENSDEPWYRGVHCEDEKGERVYLGQFKDGTKVQVSDLKREGYKLVSCTDAKSYYNGNWNTSAQATKDSETNEIISFWVQAPIRLTMIWEKIASVIDPTPTEPAVPIVPAAPSGGEAGDVKSSAGKNCIGLGSVVTINGSRYKVVEVKDDAYVVVSFDSLPDEDVKDLNALFAKLFTPEQQAKIKNIGQLLDSEDVVAIFGKPGNHPVFEVNKAFVQ